jgi:hypothetical protein
MKALRPLCIDHVVARRLSKVENNILIIKLLIDLYNVIYTVGGLWPAQQIRCCIYCFGPILKDAPGRSSEEEI